MTRSIAMWARVVVLVLFLVAAVWTVVGIVAKVIHPYRMIAVNEQQLDGTDQQIAALNAQNDDLRHRISYLKTRAGVITEARGLGYYLPGERPIIIEGVPTEWSEQATVTHSDAPGWKDRLSAIWHSIGRL